jgi:hypothetical protein
MVKSQLKTNPVQIALQHQELTKTSTKSMLLFIKTVAEPLINGFKEIKGKNQEEKSRSLAQRWTVLPSWQRAGSYRPLRDAVFDKKRHKTDCPPPLLTGFSFLWLLFVP